jgi:hypothetical protein
MVRAFDNGASMSRGRFDLVEFAENLVASALRKRQPRCRSAVPERVANQTLRGFV